MVNSTVNEILKIFISDEIKFVDCFIQACDEKSNPEVLEGCMIDVSDREKAIKLLQ